MPVPYLQIAQLLLEAYFQYMKQAGATEEEQERVFREELEKFKMNDPADLPDV